MIFWTYTCPDCGLVVKTGHQTVQLVEIKVCNCPSTPVESTEGEEPAE